MQQNILPLLRLLSDGHFHSGEAIAAALNISRTAVWKKIKKCHALGVIIESVKGRGYRMTRPFDLLQREKIFALLSSDALRQFPSLDVLEEVDSTNRYVFDYIDQNSHLPYVCFAEYQTGGRGRRGRLWHSPLGNIAFSMAWSFERGVVAIEGLSLLVGLAVVKALASEGVEHVQLKWPNDVLCKQAKLAGILLEMKGDPQGLCQIIIGVGINMALPMGLEEIDQAYASVFDKNPKVSRNRLCAQLLNQLAAMMPVFAEKGFAPFADEWKRYDAYAGKIVRLSSGEYLKEGVAKGVTQKGALLLECDGNLEEVYAGELSLRLRDDS